ncbi:maleylpyruvate isomerase family mycothiol-dependent enzyme [Aeromicrobium senzhongii]|uniref:Maleylpyruvate isomerase family mycothiol-dependent enzyme n=1 Tax=Aeromicrobium senzhongii TaxID=2663859 RepID=A0ABX6T1C2_9ACTN|nr:maleylpyruvate isomerase family mycothiol-dependent enzyme [Aeromicrobium senzhongii]MTB87737.1 maleylpyruvate isomerase family mycothiol-dependent enzyme [Aeromicrobium senzhongii]QNL95235.1 maleylpyruvate isomerase family mycothiol-dependent enzyme [Aeromicrobium senzhongii]
MTDVWPLVHEQRRALIADLEQVSPAAWDTPSLCPGWTVHDVAAHLVDSALTTRRGFAVALVRARFDFHRLNERGVQRRRGRTPTETLDRLRAAADNTATPPAPLDSRLVEEVVHGEDIRRPLGIEHVYPQEAVLRAIGSQVRTPGSLGGAKDHLSAVSVAATDAELELGDGPVVSGPALSVLLALSGRTVALDDLDGAGVPVLAARLT